MGTTDDVRVELYRSFIEEGRAPTPAETAGALDIPATEVEASLRELAEQDVIAFRPGTEDLWLAHPFCATEAPFKVAAGPRSWDAICIWDALGILALTEQAGSVETACPDCAEPLQIEVDEGRIEAPPGAVVHFGVPAARWYEDVAYT